MKSTNKAPRKKANIATSHERGALAHEKERTDETGSVVGGAGSGDDQQRTAEESPGVAVGTLPELEPEQRDEDDDEAQEHRAVPRGRFHPPTREQLLSWAPFWGVILLGAILRFWGLGDKPLHHDESLHAYFGLTLMHTTLENWSRCVQNTIGGCYQYNPLLHGPFQFHMIAIVYKICQLLGVSDNGVNTTTVRLGAATLGTVIVGLPYFLRNYMGRLGAWLACFLLAVSPSMVYFSRFAREDIYMACFTLVTVVGIGCYVRSRRSGWLVFAAAGFSLSYATKEATFLSIAIFGSFLALVLVWELGVRWSVRSHAYQNKAYTRYMPQTAGPLAVVAFLIVLLPLVKLFFDRMKDLSTYVTDPRTADASKAYVQNLKSVTEGLFPWLGIVLCLIVAGILFWEIYGPEPKPGRRGLAKYVDPERQPLLDTLVTMPWTHWFFAVVVGLFIFMVLYTALFTNLPHGIGDGVWQGLYYWLQQQQVARGGQPWYYYLLLIPLYEQIGLIFGIVGLVRCLMHPTRFRFFLVYWFLASLFIYSWAGEKMPWLVIHITMPMLLLAGIGLEPVAARVLALIREWRSSGFSQAATTRAKPAFVSARQRTRQRISSGGIVLAALAAAFLLVLTLQNMFQVTYIHAADGPHEMLIYVQTTQDVPLVMSKIDALDQQKFGGKHDMPIGVMEDADWPFYWYLRDYHNVCYTYPQGCSTTSPAVILSGGDNLGSAETQYATSANGKPAPYLFHQYHLRTWWDEGYKPPPCIATATNKCVGQPTYGGVGPFLWLSYGDTPPPNAKFDLGKAAGRLWQWWWQRTAFGSTDGSTDMGLLIRSDLQTQP